MDRTQLQLCGATALLIATKFEETWPLELDDLVYSTDSTFTKEQFLRGEASMLSVLEFDICNPSPWHFLEHFHREMNCSYEQRHLMQYVLELCLLQVETVTILP